MMTQGSGEDFTHSCPVSASPRWGQDDVSQSGCVATAGFDLQI